MTKNSKLRNWDILNSKKGNGELEKLKNDIIKNLEGIKNRLKATFLEIREIPADLKIEMVTKVESHLLIR